VFSFNHPSTIRFIDSCILNFIVLDFIILSPILFIYSYNGSVKITNNSF
jgi:predicted metal-dependent RNase